MYKHFYDTELILLKLNVGRFTALFIVLYFHACCKFFFIIPFSNWLHLETYMPVCLSS